MPCRIFRFLSALVVAGFLGVWLAVADRCAGQPGDSALPENVAAMVGDQPVYRGELVQALRSLRHTMSLEPQTTASLESQVLKQIVHRRLVEKRLRREGRWVEPDAVAQRIEKHKIDLQAEGRSLGDLLQQSGHSLASLQEQIAWEQSWSRYLESTLDDAFLKLFFEKHREQFDGSQRRVRHILLRPETSADPEELAELIRRSRELRDRIIRGEVAFEDAARSESSGPSRSRGGDLGFITRQGLMAESFAAEAFRLKPGQLSEPVITRFGIHLIEVTEIKPGSKKWQEMQQPLRLSAEAFLLERLADAERQTTPVRYRAGLAQQGPAQE